jgi:hypothetical protein
MDRINAAPFSECDYANILKITLTITPSTGSRILTGMGIRTGETPVKNKVYTYISSLFYIAE